MTGVVHGLAAGTDAQVFLGRLTRLDPGALVRLRPAGPGRATLWARLPWGVLVAREVMVEVAGDQTHAAAALLAAEPGPPRRDPEWRWPLPPGAGVVVEAVPADRLRAVAEAAAGTLREVSTAGLAGRRVGARVLREALLDHVPIVVEAPLPVLSGDPAGAGDRIEVPQRLVQAVVRMGFLGPAGTPGDTAVRVRRAQRWTGLAARYGSGWLPPAGLVVRPVRAV